MLCAAQEQGIMTNYVKHHIDKTSENPVLIMWKKRESVQHPVSDMRNCLRTNVRDDMTI